MTNVTTLITPQFIVPIEPDNKVLTDHSIAIDDKGKIADVLPTKVAREKYINAKRVELPTHVIMPGLINMHTHSPATLFRSMVDDKPLMVWLEKHMWPAEKKWLSNEFVKDGTRLAIAEMLKCGTTCFQEHYFFMHSITDAVLDAKMRAVVGAHLIKFPTPWCSNMAECLQKSEQFLDDFQNHPLIKVNLAPHAPYSLDDADFQKMAELAKKYNCSIHMHLHESEQEIVDSMRDFKMRPLERIQKFGILDFPFNAAHMVQLNDEDFALLKQNPHITVVHCPESNLKLGNGICPVAKLVELGVNVTVGTDSAASNNDLDMFSEMRTATLLAKGFVHDPVAVSAATALRMATLNAAKALGLDDQIGSIEIGKMADIIAVDLSSLNTQPLYNPISNLVYAVNSRQVSDVWVAGERLLANGNLTTIDEKEILVNAKEWQEKISEL